MHIKKLVLSTFTTIASLFSISLHAQGAPPPPRPPFSATYFAANEFTHESPSLEAAAKTRIFREQCSAVVAIERYCTCLSTKLPVGLTFQQFVTVLSRTKEENGYSSLGKGSRLTYDAMPKIRDQCAAASSGAP